MNLFEIKNVSFRYNGRWILEKINLTVRAGTLFTLVGPNGSGKTTLIKLLTGLLRPQKGRVLYANRDVSKIRSGEFPVGYVPQLSASREINVKMLLTVEDVVRLGMKRPGAHCREKVRQTLDLLKIAGLSGELFMNLSGGQKQKVFLARALVNDPSALIMDEPAAGIDSESEFHLFRFLTRLNRRKKVTIILVTHDLDLVPKISDSVGCLDRRLFVHSRVKGFMSCPVFKGRMNQGLELLVHGRSIPHRLVRAHGTKD